MEYKKTTKNSATKPKSTNFTCASNLQSLKIKTKKGPISYCVSERFIESFDTSSFF